MRSTSLTLIGSNPAVASDPRVRATLDGWPDDNRPPIHTTTIDQVLNDDSILDRSSVAWILLDQPDDPHLFQLIGRLQDRDLPAMVSRPNEPRATGTSFQQGIVVGCLDADAPQLRAALGVLWSQAAVVRSLKAEVRMLQAHHGGLCDQIDKIDEELRLAAKLQREFLPRPMMTCHNIEFRVLYRPAGYVSGDIYDMMPLDEDHVGFFLADAAGHGVPAALMTMYIKRALHTRDVDVTSPGGYRVVPPDEAISRLNKDMVRQQTGKTGFATACYGVINCQTMELSLARAGHPFPLLLRSNGSVTTLEPDGMLMGVFSENKYDMVRCRLHPGDRLLLYSDGFEMAFPEPAGEQDQATHPANMRYTEEFKDLANGPIDQAIQRLERKLDQQIGSLNQRDDLTVLCLSVRDKSVDHTAQQRSQDTVSAILAP